MFVLSGKLSLLKEMKKNPLPKPGFSLLKVQGVLQYVLLCQGSFDLFDLHNVVVGLECEERCVYSVTCSIL